VLELTDIANAILLGIVEGLTEFLPVSSTAHLLLTSYLINFQPVKNNLFEIVIQLGAILAICVLYRQKIFDILWNLKRKPQQKFVLNLILAFMPAAFIGSVFHGFIKSFLFTNFVIALALIVGGILMIIVDYKPFNSRSTKHTETSSAQSAQSTKINDLYKITYSTAFYIGLFQCLAMIPGISRSGATIIAGLLLGLNRKTAAEFSFFLAIPTIAAASFYDLFKNTAELTYVNIEIILLGLASSFVAAILVIKWFVNFISKNSFAPFGIYRIIVGILVLLCLQ